MSSPQDSSRPSTANAEEFQDNILGQKRAFDQLDNDFEASESEEKEEKRQGRRKIQIEYIKEKSRRHITFSKRKAGIMKKAYELSTLTGTQVLLLVASETGHVYTFATPKLQPIITQSEGKNLIQSCLNAPDPTPAATESSPQSATAYAGSGSTASTPNHRAAYHPGPISNNNSIHSPLSSTPTGHTQSMPTLSQVANIGYSSNPSQFAALQNQLYSTGMNSGMNLPPSYMQQYAQNLNASSLGMGGSYGLHSQSGNNDSLNIGAHTTLQPSDEN